MKAIIVIFLTTVLSFALYGMFVEGADKQAAAPLQIAPKSGQITLGKNMEIQNINPKNR